MELWLAKPKKRSPLRLWLGSKYYCMGRWMWWLTGGVKFAKRRPQVECQYLCADHATPLMRQLKDVDMWMQENKVINLRLAVDKLDGLTLLPGESLSYWRAIGRPTRRKGYVEGMVLHLGQVVPGVGGGLCQCSNLLYWMTLHTPLTVTERHHHSYDVFPDSRRTQPFGSGATCSYNYRDLMIENRTPHTWRLCLQVTDTHLEGAWHCDSPQNLRYEIYEKDHFMRGERWGGYTRHNTIFRRVFDGNGAQIGDEYICENHAMMMYEPLLPPAEEKV